jgi:hypothetical protein
VAGLQKFSILLLMLTVALPVYAQTGSVAPESLEETVRGLQAETRELRAMLEQMRAETSSLRKELEATREQRPANPAESTDQKLQKIEEEQQLLGAKVEEQHQTKIESASKYHVRLSGIVLTNFFSNSGVVDNIDFPSLALENVVPYSSGSFGGSLRQSLIGLDVTGPQVSGARVSADIQFDFAGGFPSTPDGVLYGIPRLRTGNVRMEWNKTSIRAGQDTPFISPLSPTSVATLATPAMSYSGNLWTWLPQVRVERRMSASETADVVIQAGILDPLTGELPGSQFRRTAQAGETSKQPAYATRLAWTQGKSDDRLAIGLSGYYSRQAWGFRRTTDAWAATSDWVVPFTHRFELSGEFYRGRGIGGLGGGLGRTAVFSGPVTDRATLISGANSIGGWTQIKLRQTEKLEWNGAIGLDNVLAQDLRRYTIAPDNYYGSLARNQSAFVNFIYRPRSNLLFSTEYRRFKTSTIRGTSERAGHLNVGMGVLF